MSNIQPAFFPSVKASLVLVQGSDVTMVCSINDAKDHGFNPKDPSHKIYQGHSCGSCGETYPRAIDVECCSCSDY